MASRTPARIVPPDVGGALHRRRLCARLDAIRARPGAVWIEGPAGSGKTTLAADWSARAGGPRVWLRADPGDVDPVPFLSDLREAVRRASSRSRRPLPALRAAPADPLAFGRRFFRAAWARLGEGAVLALDDLHAVAESGVVPALLAVVLAERPAGACLLLASRRGPPEALARALAHGELARLGAGALAFTPEETARLVCRHEGHRADPQHLAAIQTRSGGWAVAVRLLCGERGADGRRVPREDLAGYFEAEILAGLSSAERRTLACAALLPEVTGAQLAALGEDPGAGEVLAGLEARGVVARASGPVHAPDAAYTLHELFREFLRARGPRELGAAAWAGRVRGAARVCEAAGAPDAAAGLLMQQGEADALADLAERQAPLLAAVGRRVTLARWLAALPLEALSQRPVLRLWQGVCRITEDPRGARAMLEGAFHALCERGDADAAWLAWAATTDSYFVGRGDAPRLAAWLAGHDRVARALGPPREGGVALAVWTARLLAGVVGDPADPALADCEASALAHLDRPLPAQARVGLGIGLVHRLAWSGDPGRLDAVLDRVRPLVRRDEVDPYARFHWHGAEATAAWCRGDLAACLEHVALAESLPDDAAGRAGQVHVSAQAVWGLLHAGAVAGARRRLSALAETLEGAGEFERAEYDTLQGLSALAEGEPARARGHLDQALTVLGDGPGPAVLAGVARTLRARARLGEGDPAGAELDLRRAAGHAVGSRLVALGVALARAELPGAPPERLASALEAAERAGLRVVPGWLPDRVAALCARALEADVAPEAARRLARRARLPAPERLAPRVAWPARLEIRTLGGLALRRDGQVLDPGGLRPRARQLLEALIAAGGRRVPVLDLLEALWPDAAYARAGQRSFDTTLHRLRRHLEVEEALVLADGRLGLDPRWVALDAWRLADLAASPSGDPREDGAAALALYGGAFLGDEEVPFAAGRREALREALARVLAAWARAAPAEGASAFEQALQRDPQAEPLHRSRPALTGPERAASRRRSAR